LYWLKKPVKLAIVVYIVSLEYFRFES